MTDTITLTGVVATDPKHLLTGSGVRITSFRLASAQRRYDRQKGEWVDVDTNWYTVSSFRQASVNVLQSVRKGQHVLVVGRLRVRDWQAGDRSGTSVDVDADAIGHDLSWGTAEFKRVPLTSSESGATPASIDGDGEEEAAPSEASDSDAEAASTVVTPF